MQSRRCLHGRIVLTWARPNLARGISRIWSRADPTTCCLHGCRLCRSSPRRCISPAGASRALPTSPLCAVGPLAGAGWRGTRSEINFIGSSAPLHSSALARSPCPPVYHVRLFLLVAKSVQPACATVSVLAICCGERSHLVHSQPGSLVTPPHRGAHWPGQVSTLFPPRRVLCLHSAA